MSARGLSSFTSPLNGFWDSIKSLVSNNGSDRKQRLRRGSQNSHAVANGTTDDVVSRRKKRMLRLLAPSKGAAAAAAAASSSAPSKKPKRLSSLAKRISTTMVGRGVILTGKRQRRPPMVYTPSKRQRSGPVCEKCDGSHTASSCPHYRKQRGSHPDEIRAAVGKRSIFSDSGRTFVLRRDACRVVRQPGDGSCLFHSLAYSSSSNRRGSAQRTRRAIAAYIADNADMLIADSPLRDWIQWESGLTVARYSQRMGGSMAWGGGIEMAAYSRLKRVNVHVYERARGAFKRIGCFDFPGAMRTVSVLYGGRVHFDHLRVL